MVKKLAYVDMQYADLHGQIILIFKEIQDEFVYVSSNGYVSKEKKYKFKETIMEENMLVKLPKVMVFELNVFPKIVLN